MSAGRVRRLESEYDIEVQYTYYPLHPETPIEGRPILELYSGREEAWTGMSAQLVLLMEAEGLEYGVRTHTYNSRLAQELAAWGDEKGVTDELHDALFKAYFVKNWNVAHAEVLVDAAASVGLDAAEVHAVLEERTYRDTVDDHWKRTTDLGVTGVPTCVSEGFGVVGAQPYKVLEDLASRAGAVRR